MAKDDRQKPTQDKRKPAAAPPRERSKERPGEGFERRPKPQGLEIEKADRRGYGQDREKS